MSPDFKVIDAHLDAILAGTTWVLTSIEEIQDGQEFRTETHTRTFGPARREEMHAWITAEQKRERNVYVHYNPMKGSPRSKPPKSAVIGLAWVYVDIDPTKPPEGCADVAAHYAAERERIRALCENLPNGVPRPTVCVFSGGGYQLAWRLKTPELSDGSKERIAELERYSRRLEEVFAADHCHNLDRMLRLAGTWNFPNAKKRAAGRTEPVLAELCWTDGPIADLAQFEKAAPKGQTTSKPVAPAPGAPVRHYKKTSQIPRIGRSKKYELLRTVIEKGLDPEDPDRHPSKSEWQHFACCEMVRAGCGDDVILSVITDPNWPISATVFEHGGDDYAQKQIENARAEVEGEFAKNQYGLPVQNLRNRRLAFRKLGLTFRYNELTREVEVCGLRGRSTTLMLGDNEAADIRGDMELQFGLSSSKDDLFHAAGYEARHDSYHPVIEYLDGLPKWDGRERIGSWLVKYLSAPDTPYVRSIGRIFLLGAVRRMRHPGCKFDELVILEGEQGSNKSTALAELVPDPEWFTDDLNLGLKSREFVEQTGGFWICEVAEMAGMRQTQVEALKAQLSRVKDRARMAYDRTAQNYLRQFVLIGTTNSDAYLSDITGNRRFWPVRTGAIDVLGIRADREQLWAEAVAVEAEGGPHLLRLPPELWEVARVEQDARMQVSPLQEVLEEHLGGVGDDCFVRSSAAWEILNVPEDRRSSISRDFGKAMRALGFVDGTKKLAPIGKPNEPAKVTRTWTRGRPEVELIVSAEWNGQRVVSVIRDDRAPDPYPEVGPSKVNDARVLG
jgi:predicted P-loop ATPase